MKKNALYLECYSGISGDMFIGAMLDLGVDFGYLKSELKKLHLDGYHVVYDRVSKCGVMSGSFDVILEEGCVHKQEHHHEGGKEHHHGHMHRTYRDIQQMIRKSELSEAVKERTLAIFGILAKVEGKVHGKPADEVAFHEVGAVDSIVDIAGAAICMEYLGISEILVSDMYEGKGHCWCQHGKIPVPVPAVMELCLRHSLPLHITDIEGEMITPTGAAIAAHARNPESVLDDYQMCRVGIGAGKKDFPHANILRAILLEKEMQPSEEQERVWVLESNIDDCSGEIAGYTISLLMAAGALDASCFPCMMKKGRPGFMLQVICREEQIEKLEDIIFRETTSIGLRKYQEERSILPRAIREVDTVWGAVSVKICRHKSLVFAYPEFEDVKAICEKTGKSFREVYDAVTEQAAKAD